MSVSRLETELVRIKRDLESARKANNNFCSVLERINNIKQQSLDNPRVKENISSEFNRSEVIELFSSIEKDFEDLKTEINKQELFRDRVSDFVESLATRKRFQFGSVDGAKDFLERVVEELDADLISIRPEFLGTIDLSDVAISVGLHKTGNCIVVQRELFSRVVDILVGRRIFRNLIFEISNAKIILKSSNEVVVESDNYNIRRVKHLR